MKKVRIYLAGTIYKEEPDKLWKRQLRDYFNPKEDVADQNLQNDMYDFFDPDPQPGADVYVVARDKAEIQKCDILVAYIQRPTVGTSMEILYAHMLGTKPIIIINPNGKMLGDLWLRSCSQCWTKSILECSEWIKSMRF